MAPLLADEAAYKRTDYLEQRRPLMQQWATFATTKPKGKVVAFGGATGAREARG